VDRLLFQIGSSFLRAFAASLVVLALGVLAAPNLNEAYLMGVAAIAASIAAGLRAVQAYIPNLSIAKYLGAPWGSLADSFVRAFAATFITLAAGVLQAPDLLADRAAWTAVITGAVAASIRVLQGALTKGEWPARQEGIAAPPARPAPSG
jgi:hypothetical protein